VLRATVLEWGEKKTAGGLPKDGEVLPPVVMDGIETGMGTGFFTESVPAGIGIGQRYQAHRRRQPKLFKFRT